MNDLISRQDAIDALEEPCKVPDTWSDEYAVGERQQWEKDVKALKALPPAQPEIIRCKDCVKHNRDIGDFKDKADNKNRFFWKDEACPLVHYRGKAQGHEFDYQYCCYAERRTDG